MADSGTFNRQLRPFRALALLSVVAPLLIYGVLGVLRYLESMDAAELRVARSLRVSHEHAARVFAGVQAIHERVFDHVAGRSLADLQASAEALHDALVTAANGQVQIQSIWVIGPDGKAIASSLPGPVPTNDYSDRPYFVHHRQARGGLYVSEPFNSRATGERVLDISRRLDMPDGRFGGVVTVSLHASYFQQFYADLVAEEPGLAVNMFVEGGAIVARYPAIPSAPTRMTSASPVLQSLQAGNRSGRVRGVSSVDGQDRLLAFDRVGHLPIYVGTGMNITALRLGVAKELGFLVALGLLPFGALFYAANAAAKRTRDALRAADLLREETATRQRAEEALLQAQKLEALGRLTGGVAHDFNNALMVISNNAHLLRREVSPGGEPRLRAIGRAVDSATKLTRQLLAFSRRQALLPQVVRLQETLPACRELLVPALGSRVELEVQVDPATPSILVDLAELELALLNLSINARDAMPEGGKVSVRARIAGPEKPPRIAGEAVVLEVADTGEGIDEALMGKVFEPFFTTKPVGQGTGLGLSQVYGFCERAGGAAAIASVRGRGTTVSMFFPAGPASVQPVGQQPSSVERPLRKTLLVVEDNEEVAAALMPLLEGLGCMARRVPSAAAAIEWLSTRPSLPDVVLTDVVMPGGMDGIALAKWIRGRWPEQPVLLMTGYAERLDEAVAAGFEVLPKPCSPEALRGAIARVGGEMSESTF